MNRNIQNIFKEVPQTYELVNHILTFGMDTLWRKRAVKIAARDGGTLWLDICSGTGETAHYLRRIAPKDTAVVSADFCEPMLKMAAQKSMADSVLFTLADATELPFGDGTFDLVTISFATRNINVTQTSLERCLKEFCRVLKKGGRFVNLETSQPPSKIFQKLFHAYMRAAVRPIGEAISGSKAGYSYLSRTIPRFYGAEELADIIRKAGFSRVEYQRMMFGAAAIHTAFK